MGDLKLSQALAHEAHKGRSFVAPDGEGLCWTLCILIPAALACPAMMASFNLNGMLESALDAGHACAMRRGVVQLRMHAMHQMCAGL